VVVNPFRRQLPVYSPVSLPAAVVAALHAALPTNDPQAQLRCLLARRFNADDVGLYDSGTLALTAALTIASRHRESRVAALPAFGCYDIATAAVGADVRIALYDVDPVTLNPDWESVERALRAGATILVIAPLYGYPVDWHAAAEVTQRYGTLIIEDAAQGAGGEWGGRPVGSLGDLSVLSFGRGKGWTGGSGGALLDRCSATGASSADVLLAQGSSSVPLAAAAMILALGRTATYGLPHALPWLKLGRTVYRPPRPARQIARFAAALALATEHLARAELEERRRRAAILTEALRECDGVVPIRPVADASPGFLRLPCTIPGPAAPEFVGTQAGRLGIERGYPLTLANLEPVNNRRVATGCNLQGAESLARNLVTLPTHSRSTVEDCGTLVGFVRLHAPTDRQEPGDKVLVTRQ
jgi:perosamine synthetase